MKLIELYDNEKIEDFYLNPEFIVSISKIETGWNICMVNGENFEINDDQFEKLTEFVKKGRI